MHDTATIQDRPSGALLVPFGAEHDNQAQGNVPILLEEDNRLGGELDGAGIDGGCVGLRGWYGQSDRGQDG